MSGVPPTGVQAEAPLLERERELGRIRRSLTAAGAGDGGVLLIEGPAGIGKTTLAHAARDQARAGGMRVLRAAGNELEGDIAYGVVQQLLVPVLRSAKGEEQARLLDGANAASSLLLPRGSAVSDDQPGSEFAMLHALYWLLANLSDEQPLLLVIDDMHWADQASARFVAFLSPRLRELPVLVLMCARPEDWSPEVLFASTASDVGMQPLVPAPLSEPACGVLTRARFEQPVDDTFVSALHQATGGNPFLLNALLDELVGDRIAPQRTSVDAVLMMGPRVVTRAIAARLGRLSASARSLVAALTVLGDDAPGAQLRALAGLSEDDLQLAAAELVRVSVAAPGDGLRFAHPIVRNAVSADIAPAELDRLHRVAVDLLERDGASPERIASHLIAVRPRGEDHICALLRRAAAAALASGAVHSSVAYLRRALAEPCQDDDRAELLLELGQAERLIDGPAAITHLQEALALSTDPARYATVAHHLAVVLINLAHASDAAAIAAQALAGLGSNDRDLRRRLQATIVRAGEHGPVPGLMHQILAELEQVENEDGLGARAIQAVRAFEQMVLLQQPATVLAARAAELLADELPLREDNGGTSFTAPIQILVVADSDLAREWLERGLDRARRMGDGYAVASNLFMTCWLHLLRGELLESAAAGVEGVAAMEQWGVEGGRVWCASLLADAYIEVGDLAGADRALARVAPLEGPLPETIGWDAYRWSVGSLALARGDSRTCLTMTLETAELDGEPIQPAGLPWRSRAAVCLTLLREDPERALSLAQEEVELARRWGAPGALGIALRGLGVVLGDGPGEQPLREAIAVLDGSVAKLEHARALVELGAMLRRTGRRDDARELLRTGLKLARLCGATPLAERADNELRSSGVSSRNALRAGVDELTSSEHRVVTMAASGLTNKQIAQALFVTVKTIETHLYRSYQKLGVGSRAELSAALQTPA
jgi:DNA-binding CsgD family transcriptional regulator